MPGGNAFLTCTETTATLDGGNSSGGMLSFEWFDPNNLSISVDQTVEVAESGMYLLVVTDLVNGCSANDFIDVVPDANLPIADPGTVGILTCENDELTLDGSNSMGGTLVYEWQDGSGTVISQGSTVDVTAPDDYTLIVTDTDNGCSAMSMISVPQDITAPLADAGDDATLNCIVSNTLLDGGNSTGGVTLTYVWRNSVGVEVANTPTYDATSADTYSLVVTNEDNGCTATDQVEVIADLNAPLADAGPNGLLTCISTDYELNAGSSTGGTLTYEWFDGNNTSLGNEVQLSVTDPGTYTVEVTDEDNGCTATAFAIINEDVAPPLAEAGNGASLTCEATEVSLSGSGSSTGANIEYLWENAGGVNVGEMINAQVTETGVYTLIVTNTNNGCTASDFVEVTPDSNLPTADAGTGSTLNCAITEAVIDGSNSSSGTEITYEWLDPNGDFLTVSLMETVSIPGTYTLVVSNTDNGCTATSAVEILQDITPPVADAGADATLTCDATSATLDGGASTAAMGDLNFEWFDDNNQLVSNQEQLDVTQSGMYTLIVTADNGCTAMDAAEVNLDADVPVADVGAGGILNCATTVVTLGGSNTSTGNNLVYEWLDDNNQMIASTASTDVTAPGTYTFSVTNTENNCVTTAAITIDQDILEPIADAGTMATLTCIETTFTLGGATTSVGGNITYEWLDGTNTLIGSDLNLAVTQPDDYTLIVTNTDNQCTAESSVEITENVDTPIADAGSNGTLTCDVTEVPLDGSSSTGQNLIYSWRNEAGVEVSDQPMTMVGETGTYTLIVTNTASGCTASAEAIIVPDANLPSAVATTNGILTCVNDQVTLIGSSSSSVSGGIAYEWLDEDGNTLSVVEDFAVGTAGIYTLVITDTQNGCTAATSIPVNQDITPPDADAGGNQTLICGQTSVSLVGMGSNGNNLSYQWLDEDANVIATTSTVDVAAAGNYTLIVTNDDNGCSAMAAAQVVPDNNLPTAAAVTMEDLTCTNQLVELDGTGSSTGTNITYEWQDENGTVLGNEVNLSVAAPGIYTLFVLDTNNNCESQDNVTVLEDITPPVADVINLSASDINCINNTVVLDGISSQPLGVLEYSWSTPDGNIVGSTDLSNITVDEAGTYTLLVTNTQNGCTHTNAMQVDADLTAPVALVNEADELTCVLTTLTLDGTASSTNGNFTYSWTSIPAGGVIANGNSLQPQINQAGTYTLLVVNGDNGCETTANVTVGENTLSPNAMAAATGEFDCLTESVSLDGSGSSVGNNFTYNWDGPALDNPSMLNPVVSAPGLYTLLVTDTDNGCTETAEVLVTEDEDVPSAANIEINDPACFGDNGLVNVLEVTGGEAPYLYSLDGGESFTPQGFYPAMEPGVYNLLIQDAKGCEYEEQIVIQAPIELEVTAGELETVELILGDDHQIDAEINVPLAAIDTIIWFPAEGLSCTDCLNPEVDILETTTYTITVINENGCIAIDEITLRVDKQRDVYIPNAFSPNNADGNNDVFMLYGSESRVERVKMLRIFDRWGALVFEAYDFELADPDFAWDGTLRGEPLNPAVFVYVTEIEFIDGVTEIFKGDVTIVE